MIRSPSYVTGGEGEVVFRRGYRMVTKRRTSRTISYRCLLSVLRARCSSLRRANPVMSYRKSSQHTFSSNPNGEDLRGAPSFTGTTRKGVAFCDRRSCCK